MGVTPCVQRVKPLRHPGNLSDHTLVKHNSCTTPGHINMTRQCRDDRWNLQTPLSRSECVQDIRRAHTIHPISCVELEWSLFARDAEVGLSSVVNFEVQVQGCPSFRVCVCMRCSHDICDWVSADKPQAVRMSLLR